MGTQCIKVWEGELRQVDIKKGAGKGRQGEGSGERG